MNIATRLGLKFSWREEKPVQTKTKKTLKWLKNPIDHERLSHNKLYRKYDSDLKHEFCFFGTVHNFRFFPPDIIIIIIIE